MAEHNNQVDTVKLVPNKSLLLALKAMPLYITHEPSMKVWIGFFKTNFSFQ